MPEIKNLFTSGRMNKDLDERLIPSNQYRDALNIQVSSSEGSDVGAIENILGNKSIINKAYNIDTQVHTKYNVQTPGFDIFGLPDDSKTIGSIRFDKTECIYWFVTSDTVDAIIEYNQSTDVVSPIIVDKNNVLKFSKNKLITGINIIEDLLFFTDDNSEPKCINIKRFKEASSVSANGFTNHTEIYGRDFIEEDTTVIKKSPLTAPLIEKRDSKRTGAGVGLNFLTVNKNFTQLINGGPEFESLPSGSTVNLSWNSSPDYKVGDVLVLTSEFSENTNELETFEIKIQIQSLTAQNSSVTGVLLAIPLNLPNESLLWEVLLQEEDSMFTYKFPRFAYRWKYNDGQYSTFSPFTQAVFLPGNFEYLSSNGYNLGMVNNIRYLKVYGLENPPEDVIEIEILYKESNNNLVYSVDTVPLDNPQLEIESELIHKVIEGNQILRPWDNVPLKAKSQEIIANRIVYANYLQNFNVDSPLETEFYINSAEHSNTGEPIESIKTIRNYQLGVVWKDKYGRETPVFTSKESAVILDGSESGKMNSIKARIKSPPPTFATHFKYFIKETANEYYNLALDRFYLAEDGNVWLSFPSSERNKVDNETYLYLKKQHNTNVIVTDFPKYKILDISNEAPNFIAETKKAIASADVTANQASNPGVDVVGFEFTGPTAAANPDFYSAFKSQNLLSIKYSSSITKDYEIVSGGPTGSNNIFRVTISEPMQESFLNDIVQNEQFEIIVKEKIIEKKPEFEGRFFVKVNRDTSFTFNIIDAFSSVNIQYGIIDSSDIDERPISEGRGDSRSSLAFNDPIADYGYKNDLGAPVAQSNKFGICWAAYEGGYSSPAITTKPSHPIIDDHLSSVGAKVRFYNSNGVKSEVYTVTKAVVTAERRENVNAGYVTAGNTAKVVICTLDRNFESGFGVAVGLEIVEEIITDNNDLLSSRNPAIFETEPKENIELDIYYEASDAFAVSEVNDLKTLSWFNCYSFGNGVESDRIRDDYNTVRIDKGVKVSAVLDEPYAEERRSSGFIFSQIFNSISGINRLNQFIQALPITKDLNPVYGSIQKLHARDTDLVTLCEDKCLKILANKDALFNADGNTNITSNNNVLGQAIPFAGEYGISKNPESFASYGFRIYFSDKNRGVVLRLSIDGLEEISSQGMSDYFSDKLANESVIIGSYDDYSNCYNISFSDETVSYKQGLQGWPTRKSFVPESGVSLNNIYYTFKGSKIWPHNNEIRNNFYGTQYKSTVKLIFNVDPSKVKNFKTISYEGSSGWVTPNITTDLQNGKILSYIPKEGIYYNFVKGIENTWDNSSQTGSLDTSEFSTQGIDILQSITGDVATTEFTLTIKENND